jgi:para-nitrobenzyl esterase
MFSLRNLRTLRRAAWALAFAASSLAGTCIAAPTVTIDSGNLIGKSGDGVDAYLGIPYAAAPIGAGRFAAPKAVAHWAKPRDATTYGANCPQPSTDGLAGGFGAWTSEYTISGPISEDCLFLNVWAPPPTSGSRHPVLLWIHGGGFSTGSGSVAIYEGAQLAKQGIVVVTINYRLGALGFLAAPTLGAHPGNYGILDMIAGLKWIKRNIASFGGDPSRVTIAGQSAGSAAVHVLLESPAAKGLFVGGIAESGSGVMPLGRPLTEAKTDGTAYAQSKGATTLAALRALPTSAFIDTAGGPPPSGSRPGVRVGTPTLRFSPVLDGLTVAADPKAGSDVPFLTGFVADEGSSMNPHYGQSTPAALAEEANRVYGQDAGAFLSLYPAPDDASAGLASILIKRDFSLAGGWLWALERSKTEKSPVFMYLFRHVEPGADSARYRAFHSSEIPYVFGTLDKGNRPFTDIDRQVSKTVMQYWVNFIRAGDPNQAGMPKWPALDADAPVILDIGETIAAAPLLDSQKRAFYSMELAKGVHPSLF